MKISPILQARYSLTGKGKKVINDTLVLLNFVLRNLKNTIGWFKTRVFFVRQRPMCVYVLIVGSIRFLTDNNIYAV